MRSSKMMSVLSVVLGAMFLFACADQAAAQCPRCGRNHPIAHTAQGVVRTTGHVIQHVGHTAGNVSVAAAKASRNATFGLIGMGSHSGGRLAGQYEGTGFSTRSPEQAIAVACYANDPSKVRTSVAVRRGPRGWHAVVGYSNR